MNKPLVIITGASSGIGKATAQLFSQAGYCLGLLARNIKAMEALELPNSIAIATDVTDIAQVKKAIAIATDKFGHVDGLINNAGFVKGGDFTELSHQEHMQTIDINLKGIINGIECVLPSMREHKSGTIINISSLADRKSRPQIPTYAASKAAVASLTESLRVANAPYGIRFCNIAPAKIETPMVMSISANLNLNDNQTIPVLNMAKTILWVYQQPRIICIRDLVIAPTSYEA